MPDNGNKILNAANFVSLSKLVIGVIASTVTILVFYFSMESKQDQEITKTSTTLSSHLRQSEETFRKLDRTMLEQWAVNERTSKALVRVSTIQQTLKEENGRLAESVEKLADEVRKRNGHTP